MEDTSKKVEMCSKKAFWIIDDILKSKCYETWDDDDTKMRELALQKAAYLLLEASKKEDFDE